MKCTFCGEEIQDDARFCGFCGSEQAEVPAETIPVIEENLIPEEEESSILMLTDENGEEVEFEYLDCIEYEGVEYLVLMPADDESDEVVILEVVPVDEENENYIGVEDEAVLNAVFAIFREKYKDILVFEE